jgi:hypothetical protein
VALLMNKKGSTLAYVANFKKNVKNPIMQALESNPNTLNAGCIFNSIVS